MGRSISAHPEARYYVRELLKEGAKTPALVFLAQALAEVPGLEDLLLLIDLEIKSGRSFLSMRTISSAVTKQVPSKTWKGAFEVVPIDATDLRKQLLSRTNSGDAEDRAARCLTAIDKIRDENEAPNSEPRHPDLMSGKPWPILVPDPDAEGNE